MKLPNLKLTQSEVSQTFDFKEILGVDLSDFPEVKQAIGEAIIQKIIDRTASGVDVSGKSFKKYSTNYLESDTFKAFGKSGDVDMELTGGMLGLIDIISDKGSKITIGWDDATENAKAYNHNFGDTLPKRQFFGITADDVKAISKEFKPDLRRDSNDAQLIKKLNKIAGFIEDDE